ncbi:MAG: hypothetical protein ACON5H_07785 [Akkermansiaceae bacterium]
MTGPNDPWKKLVEATKADEPEPAPEPAPTVSLQVSNFRERVQALMLALTWRKWSFLAALGAGLVYLIIYLNTREDSAVPAIQIESPSTPVTP